MYTISTNQLSLTAFKKKKQNTALMLVRFLPQPVKCATALNNLNNSLFLWLEMEKKKRRKSFFFYLLTFSITYNITSSMGLPHLNSQPCSSYTSEGYQKAAQNI